eukprot:COSAG05_NODE_10492_length_562_cov_1.311015_1_plen_159_part_10
MAPVRRRRCGAGVASALLALSIALLAATQPVSAQKMEYSDAMRLQSPPEGLDKPGLKCSACVVACDAIRHELQQVSKWTELKIMEAFEKAVTLLGDQYGYSDAEGHACYVQRGKVPVATELKIRTEFQDQVEALSGEFEEEMLEMYQKDHGAFRTEFCV